MTPGGTVEEEFGAEVLVDDPSPLRSCFPAHIQPSARNAAPSTKPLPIITQARRVEAAFFARRRRLALSSSGSSSSSGIGSGRMSDSFQTSIELVACGCKSAESDSDA